MDSIIKIDGSIGEGGGQVLRSALTLSIITNKGFLISNIRANRKDPGLKAQHLKAVDAASAISTAHVEGATYRSTNLRFAPSKIRTGRYKLDISTAGATSLVLQTIFLPLSLTNSASSVIISGGTHVPWSPSFHYLDLQWFFYLQQMGFDTHLVIDQAGYYPSGGGRIQAAIRPVRKILPLQITQRGKLLRISGISGISNLNRSIAERQKRQALLRLQKALSPDNTPEIRIKVIQFPSPSKGTFLFLIGEFETGRCCFQGLGALGKPAERVADDAVDALLAFLNNEGAVDKYLADQMVIPMCLATGKSAIFTSQVTTHLQTNISIVKTFLPDVQVQIEGELGKPAMIHINPRSGILEEIENR